MVCPDDDRRSRRKSCCVRLAGESPVAVGAGAPRSRLQVRGEIPVPERSAQAARTSPGWSILYPRIVRDFVAGDTIHPLPPTLVLGLAYSGFCSPTTDSGTGRYACHGSEVHLAFCQDAAHGTGGDTLAAGEHPADLSRPHRFGHE